MKCNLTPIDTAVRGGLGLALVASPLLNFHTQPYNWLGLIPIGTAFLSFCPLYAAFRAAFPREDSARRSAASHA